MELLLAVLIAAYAVKGVGADVAAAVAGKTPPSVLKWEARQKRRETPRAQRGYWGRIWDNAVESWADASTRRHNRRMALRQQWEARKGPEWIEKKLRKLEKAADRRRRFAERVGVLWGKAREVPENIRERRREDEAWAENARRDAERDTNVPAGLKGSTDLDADETDLDADEDEGATVLPFRPRSDSEAEVDDADSAAPRRDPGRCSWGEWEGDAPCTAYRHPGYEHCYDHLQQHQNRCTWGETERCRKPRLAGSPLCAEHHTADEKVQQAVESTLEFAERQRDLNGDTPRTTVTELSCCYGELPGREDCPSTRLWDSPFCAEHEAEWQRRRQELESASLQVYANPHHEALVNPALPCEWSGGPKGPRESCSQPRKSGWPMCAEHLARTDEQLRRAGERPFTPELAKWIAEWDDQVLAHISGPPDTGQDTDTETAHKEESTMSTTPAEITSLTDAITYTQSMGASLAKIVAQVEQWQAEIAGLARQATQAQADTETAVAYLRGADVEGNHLAALESAQEQLETIHRTFNQAAQGMAAAVDAAQAGATAYRTAHAGFTAQTGIQEQIQAAQASGNRAGKREFYEAG